MTFLGPVYNFTKKEKCLPLMTLIYKLETECWSNHLVDASICSFELVLNLKNECCPFICVEIIKCVRYIVKLVTNIYLLIKRNFCDASARMLKSPSRKVGKI